MTHRDSIVTLVATGSNTVTVIARGSHRVSGLGRDLSHAVARRSDKTVSHPPSPRHSSPLDQATVTSIIAFPCWSSTVAVNCTVAPIDSERM